MKNYTNKKFVQRDLNDESQTNFGDYMEKGNKESRRKLQSTDEVCPKSQLYIRWATCGQSISYEVRTTDMIVRYEDKMQFYTGNFYDWTTSLQECFVAKVDREGVILQWSVLQNTNVNREYSSCSGMALTETNNIIVVGVVTDSTPSPARQSALIMLMHDDLGATSPPITKVWSDSWEHDLLQPYQIATDVAVTVDGGIFVTGYINGAFTLGGNDCFVLRLNYTLDMIWVKSFGTVTNNEECMSIQITRNYDYFYLGGVQYATAGATEKSLIFYKFEAYGDTGIATSITPSGTDMLSLRRIMLTKMNPFSGLNDQNTLFFCGYTNSNNGDIIVGTVTSNALTASSFTITETFRYGSTDTETIGDCVLSEGNDYIVVVFNTKHYTNLPGTFNAATPIAYDYVYPNVISADENSPYYYSEPPCWSYTNGAGRGICQCKFLLKAFRPIVNEFILNDAIILFCSLILL